MWEGDDSAPAQRVTVPVDTAYNAVTSGGGRVALTLPLGTRTFPAPGSYSVRIRWYAWGDDGVRFWSNEFVAGSDPHVVQVRLGFVSTWSWCAALGMEVCRHDARLLTTRCCPFADCDSHTGHVGRMLGLLLTSLFPAPLPTHRRT